MSNYVLDVSAAFQIVNDTKYSAELKQILSKSNKIIAPSLFIAEASNAAWKYANFTKVPFGKAEKMILDSINLIDQYYPIQGLWKQAYLFAVKLKHPIYDCFYLSLAMEKNYTLISHDKKLLVLAKKSKIKTLY